MTSGPHGGQRSSARLGFGCSPTSDSPPPSARQAAESPRGCRAAPAGWRTSISVQLGANATATTCQASRSWRSPGGLPGPPGTHGRPTGGDRRQSGAAAGSQFGASGAGFLDQVGDRLALPAIQPAGQHAQHHLQRRGVEHGVDLISLPRLTDVGRVVEHFGPDNRLIVGTPVTDRTGCVRCRRRLGRAAQLL